MPFRFPFLFPLTKKMLIITAPSKTQEFNGRSFHITTQPQLLNKSLELIQQLKQLSKAELSSLMKTSEKLTASTYHRIHSFSTPFSCENAHQAIFTFQGDAYDAILSENYSESELEHSQKHLCVLSGLYGVLRPLDLMQPYRLEMATKLAVKGSENLYKFWKSCITETLNNALMELKDSTVVNLASVEYSKAIDKKLLKGKMIDVIFKQPHKGGLKTIPIHSKRARGSMIHYMIREKIDRAVDLQGFNLNEYSFQQEDSTETSWLFVKS